MDDLCGFLLINKPAGLTSFDCIRNIKRVLNCKIKIGHTGTLDPFATGLMIIAFARSATREIRHIIKFDKKYSATGKLGELTDTLDCTGSILKEELIESITKQKLREVIDLFESSYIQTPPHYSALKVGGYSLYELVRKKKLKEDIVQKIVELKSKKVTLHNLQLIDINLPYFTLKTHVSSGTYIRSLIYDIAKKIGNCATTYQLQRTAIGPFTIDDAIPLDMIKTKYDIIDHLMPVEVFKKHCILR